MICHVKRLLESNLIQICKEPNQIHNKLWPYEENAPTDVVRTFFSQVQIFPNPQG